MLSINLAQQPHQPFLLGPLRRPFGQVLINEIVEAGRNNFV